jgi:hypothetical protein
VQQQLAALSEYIKDGLSETMWETVQQQGIPPAGFADAHSALDQHHAPDAATAGSQGPNSHHQQQQSSVADALQQLMRVCKLLHSHKLPHDVVTSALQLLQHSPAVLWDTCTQLARHNLQELTSQLDEAEREMLAPLHWPGSSAAGAGAQHALVQHKSDQQQLVAYGNTGSSGGGGKHKLPWASGLSLPCAAAMQVRHIRFLNFQLHTPSHNLPILPPKVQRKGFCTTSFAPLLGGVSLSSGHVR